MLLRMRPSGFLFISYLFFFLEDPCHEHERKFSCRGCVQHGVPLNYECARVEGTHSLPSTSSTERKKTWLALLYSTSDPSNSREFCTNDIEVFFLLLLIFIQLYFNCGLTLKLKLFNQTRLCSSFGRQSWPAGTTTTSSINNVKRKRARAAFRNSLGGAKRIATTTVPSFSRFASRCSFPGIWKIRRKKEKEDPLRPSNPHRACCTCWYQREMRIPGECPIGHAPAVMHLITREILPRGREKKVNRSSCWRWWYISSPLLSFFLFLFYVPFLF